MSTTIKIPTIKVIFDRKNKATSSTAKERKTGLVQVEIYWNRKRKYISTGINIYKNQWSGVNGVHVVNSAHAVEYNTIINDIVRKLYDDISALSDKGNYIAMFDLHYNVNADTQLLADYAEYCVDRRKIKSTTAIFYKSKIRTIRMYGKLGCINDITYTDIVSFERYLDKERKLKKQSIQQYMTLLKLVFNTAVLENIITENPMKAYKLPHGTSAQRKFLSVADVNKIASLQLRQQASIARDYFLFQCYTGLAFADLSTLTKDMFVKDAGQWYIVRERQKTSIGYRVMLLKPALQIALKYNFTFNRLYITKYNYHLRQIGKKAGFSFKLSSHVGRHTFATWALSNGVPIEIVSKMLGHTNINTTQIYAKILAKDVEAQFKKLDELF